MSNIGFTNYDSQDYQDVWYNDEWDMYLRIPYNRTANIQAFSNKHDIDVDL